MGRLTGILLLLSLVVCHIYCTDRVTLEAGTLPSGGDLSYVIPGPFLKITSLEFDGISADFLFLKSLVFLGATAERKDEPRVRPQEWLWLYHLLDAITDMDPHFLDPYYFGNANLTWEGNLIAETNALLDKGILHRDWDFLLPFYKGFNQFYFLGDNEKASESLMVASKRPGASPVYASLAVKLSYKERKLESAIAFQEYLLEHTEEPWLRKEYEDRLSLLRGTLLLEHAATRYRQLFGGWPTTIEELVMKRFVGELPREPYGGRYYLDTEGHVMTTSRKHALPFRR